MNKKPLFAAFLTGGLVCLTSIAVARRPAAPAVTVTREAYQGWPEAYRLSNGVVDAVVVPGIGRVMAFHFTGRPDTSPFFNNPAWLGKPAPPIPNAHNPKTFPTEWHNYGGDKLWPSQQSTWPKRQPLGWPPDPNFDTGPYQVTRLPNGLRLTGPVSPYYGIQVVRDITLSRSSARVDLHDTFRKVSAAPGVFPIGIWSITQVRGDATVYLPLNLRGRFPGKGFTSLDDKPETPPNWQPHGDVLTVTRPSNVSTKVGVDDSAGWIACVFGGNLLFSEHFARDPKATYPDKNTNAQVYTMGDDTQPYMEMEVLGPLTSLKPGRALSRSMFWRLQRLPAVSTHASQTQRMVTAAMRRGS